jgi:C4-dicarboxylate-specific signal transduction histidine kinase
MKFNTNLDTELQIDVKSRTVESSIGHILLTIAFLIISQKTIFNNFHIILLTSFSIFLSVTRITLYKLYSSSLSKSKYSKIIDVVTILSGIVWGSLFSLVYLEYGLYQPPSLALYIIVAGLGAGAASSLYAQKKLLILFLSSVLICPGILIFMHEKLIHEKMFGIITIIFFVFLLSQSNRNRKNLIARFELANYLSEEAKRIEQLFNSVPGLFCYFQVDGKILASNLKWKEFQNDMETLNNFSIGLDKSFLEKIQIFSHTSKEESISFEFEFIEMENPLCFLCHAQKISSTKSIILFMMDISHSKRTQNEMKSKEAHFQHSARLIELGEMVGSIAHEINNPLAVIIGRSQVSKRILRPELEGVEKLLLNLEVIEGSASRISKLVNGMKSLVRNAENDPISFQSFEPSLEIVKFIVQSRSESKKVRFDIISETKDFEGFFRPSQIEQVLINLINNAIDAAELTEEKWVKLMITSSGKHLMFEVTDSGTGIPDEVLKKIWNPFYTTKELGRGTGLGLSISHSIILENNGNLFYKNEAKNTTFRVELPKNKNAA